MTAASKTAKTRAVAKKGPSKPPPTAPKRERMRAAPAESYFASGANKESLRFISTGCSLLDEALGGGFALGRVANIVGDKSAGKTLLAMEVAANFAHRYEDGWIRYAEAEAAFDMPYAAALGVPLDRIEFNEDEQPIATVEDLYDDMKLCLDHHKDSGAPGLYIIDSLDALSMEAELEGDFNPATYGGNKPKAIGELFRRLVDPMKKQDVAFVIVSQIRDVMNAKPFQETQKRSGGKALDFYSTHILWLYQAGKLKRTVEKIERVVGVQVNAKVKKNKVGIPFREVGYPVLFGYGIDDMTASVEWLVKNNREAMLAEAGLSKGGYAALLTKLRSSGGADARTMRLKLAAIVRREWSHIETSFLPTARKY